jgi:SAM-dependent methyltransferase
MHSCELAQALRRGECPADHRFDRFLPDELRVVSRRFWTPLIVAKRAAEWFDEVKVRTVVDIGSGAGKFCVAAALAGHARFIGLEQRSRLVAAARTLARVFEVEKRVRFVEGKFGAIATPVADAYYLYNPFGEHISGSSDCLQRVPRSLRRYARDVAAVQGLLQRARVGTYVLTYNGFGGEVPASYEQVRVDEGLRNPLQLWRKERRQPSSRFHKSD